MNLNSIQINEYDNFENGWGFYVDLENPHIPIYKQLFVVEKYRRNYYIKNKERILEYNSNYYYYKKFGVWDEKMKACSIVTNDFQISILND
jgi:hypothetical protein